MKNLRGKNAILTGGSQGLGLTIADVLLTEGVNLAIVARKIGPLEAAAQSLARPGVKVIPIAADVADGEHRKRLLTAAQAELGPIDILINNAGIEEAARFAHQEPSVVQQIININLTASLLLAQAVLPGMLERRSGQIVNIASMAGKKGLPFNAAYAASKAGMIEWTSAMQFELNGSGVGASVICPGFVSGAGKFFRDNPQTPKGIGEVTPGQVAQAVLRAIRENRQEVLVNPGPTRLLLALNALSPALGNWFVKRLGLVELFGSLAQV